MKKHIVAGSETIFDIAVEYGLRPDDIWNDPDNADLKKSRKSKNILKKGDVVCIREKKVKEASVSSEGRRSFVRKFQKKTISIRLLNSKGEPRKELPYSLDTGSEVIENKTDGEGVLTENFPSKCQALKLKIDDEWMDLKVGKFDPPDTVSGIQARLNNLGYECGNVDDDAGPSTKYALRDSQAKNELEVTGELDDATKSKLEDLHSS